MSRGQRVYLTCLKTINGSVEVKSSLDRPWDEFQNAHADKAIRFIGLAEVVYNRELLQFHPFCKNIAGLGVIWIGYIG